MNDIKRELDKLITFNARDIYRALGHNAEASYHFGIVIGHLYMIYDSIQAEEPVTPSPTATATAPEMPAEQQKYKELVEKLYKALHKYPDTALHKYPDAKYPPVSSPEELFYYLKKVTTYKNVEAVIDLINEAHNAL